MTRTLSLIFAGLSLAVPSSAAAQAVQNSVAPANVVTPAPPPREGTVGPEQLRDFSLPGTRQGPAPAAETPRATPSPVQRTAPAEPPAPPRAVPSPRQAPDRQAGSSPARQDIAGQQPAPELAPAPTALPPPTIPSGPLPGAAGPLPTSSEPLPPIAVTQAVGEQSPLLPSWWPWLVAAVLGGVGLALVLRQRRRTVLAGPQVDQFDAGPPQTAPAPPAPSPRVPAPAPNPALSPPDLPAGLVTTRLRSSQPAPAPPAVPPPAVTGGVVSKRLRAWVELNVVVREILFDEGQAVFRLDIIVANAGTARARDIALEAVATNAGEGQGAELGAFFARPAGASVAIEELGPLSETILSHELRMPRAAILAYEAQGRPLFVPVIAFTAAYRTAGSEARTGAAFLVGRGQRDTEKLAPLLLPSDAGRLLGLGVRRLDEAVRR